MEIYKTRWTLKEDLIKSLRKAINIPFEEQTLSFQELQTLCFEAGNLVNKEQLGDIELAMKISYTYISTTCH